VGGQSLPAHGQATLKRRSPGEQVVVQEIWRGAVWAARPMIVAVDEDDLVALWYPKGTAWKAPTSPPEWPRAASRGERLATCLARREWVFVDYAWDVDTLVLVRPGDWHAVWVSWLDGAHDSCADRNPQERIPIARKHWGWYVNLQEPFRRTELGFATMDLALDVIVEVDRTWRWKDEDELETFVSHGVFDRELATRVREEGLRVARRAERNEPPFDEPWSDWRPDPGWPVPELPERWDEPCR
jgi:Protein of unknown function (DUF402)